MKDEIDGTVLDREMGVLFQGTDHQIFDWIMANPTKPYSVWIVDEFEPISIDEWMDSWEK